MPDQSETLVRYPEDIAKNYVDRNVRLGEGGFARVALAEHKATGEKVAIKVMNKAQLRKMGDLHRAFREIAAMKKLSHQHIAQLYQVVETDEDIFLVLEFAPGGELFDYIITQERLEEPEARQFFRQIVSAIAYIHDKGMAHRDLKPENMLLDETNNLKLIDFGLASDPENSLIMPLVTCCGSPAYAAPELISGKAYLGHSADVWSLGVVLYGLLCGFLPFDVESEEDTYLLYQKIKRGIYEIPEWLSTGSITLLAKLLEVDPKKRITIKELLSDPWVMEGYGSKVRWESAVKKEKPDFRVVEELADIYGLPKGDMEDKIKEYKFDALTAHYFLLAKLRKNKPRFATANKQSSIMKKPVTPEKPKLIEDVKLMSLTPPPVRSIERKPRAQTMRCNGEKANDVPDEEDADLGPDLSRERASSVYTGLEMLGSPEQLSSCLLNPKTPLGLALATPKFARKLRDKVANMVTPRKVGNPEEPRKVKAVYKVSSTSTKPARQVREELERVLFHLRNRGKLTAIDSDRYIFKCRGQDEKGGRLVFELEICSIPCLDNIVGVRHKRLKGDAWSYKRICDTILNIARI